MTALNFILSQDNVVVSMDTLSLRYPENIPHKFVTKMFLLPHMSCVICGTGNMGAIVDWFCFVQKNVIANGIYQLNKLTSQAIHDFMKQQSNEISCTIYQFGLHEIDNNFHGYAYRSTNNFQSEEIQYGIGVKPTDAFIKDGQLDLSGCESEDYRELLFNIMKKQKEHDDGLEIAMRLGIGGIAQILTMDRASCVLQNYRRFDDYEECHNEMLKNLK